MRSKTNQVAPVVALAPGAAVTATATGPAVDLLSFDSALIVFNVGTITDGTHTPKIQESDDNSTWNDVYTNTTGTSPNSASTSSFAYDLVTNLGASGAAATPFNYALNPLVASTPQYASYVGAKRYIRVVVTVTGSPATGGFYNAVCVRGDATHQQQGSLTPRP